MTVIRLPEAGPCSCRRRRCSQPCTAHKSAAAPSQGLWSSGRSRPSPVPSPAATDDLPHMRRPISRIVCSYRLGMERRGTEEDLRLHFVAVLARERQLEVDARHGVQRHARRACRWSQSYLFSWCLRKSAKQKKVRLTRRRQAEGADQVDVVTCACQYAAEHHHAERIPPIRPRRRMMRN